jgi:hypothetical protein
MDWWIDGLMDWWIGGLVDWWIGGLVDWWMFDVRRSMLDEFIIGRSCRLSYHPRA